MAATRRSSSNVQYVGGSKINTIIPAPDGVEEGDELRIVFPIGQSGAAPTPTPPTGFTAKGAPYPITVTNGGFEVAVYVFEKRATDSEPANYTVLHAEAFTTAYMEAVQGAAEGPSVVTGAANPDNTTALAPGAEPENDGAHAIGWWLSFNVMGAGEPPPGFTERYDSNLSILYIATLDQAIAAPIGDQAVTVTQAPSAGGFIIVEAQAGGPVELEGTSAGSSSVRGELTVIRGLSGRVDARSNAQGSINVIRGLSARVAGSSAVRCAVNVLRPLAGIIQGISRVIGLLTSPSEAVSIKIEITDEPIGQCTITEEAVSECAITDEAAV
jgi:hypothetical protein